MVLRHSSASVSSTNQRTTTNNNNNNKKGKGTMETKKETIKPEVGMSVTYYIGSDAYHEVIVDITRNGRNVLVMSADEVLGGVSVSDWNAIPMSVRTLHARKAWIDFMAKVHENEPDEEFANRLIERVRNGNTFTLRQDGYYISKGSNCGYLKLNSTYAHLDPSF
jgi:hypothetical protein